MTTPIQPLNASMPPIASADASNSAGSNYTDLKGLAALKNTPSSPAAIRAVSQQVEALFLQMMLKSMRDASAADGEPDSNETGMYQDMFDKQVALTLSKHQDLGIARLFERQLGGKGPDLTPQRPRLREQPRLCPRSDCRRRNPTPTGVVQTPAHRSR